MKKELITAKLVRADASMDVRVITETIFSILQEDPTMTMEDFERAFRAAECENVFLVAWPKKFIPDHLRPVDIRGGEPPYALWVAVNGREDMEEQLIAFDLSPKENLAALRHTGIGMTHITKTPETFKGGSIKPTGHVCQDGDEVYYDEKEKLN